MANPNIAPTAPSTEVDPPEDKWNAYNGCPPYEPTVPEVNDIDINDEKNCPAMYTQSWSNTLQDIIYNFCRQNGILETCDYIIPKTMFEVIALFYTNDITKNKSFKDYMNAILICKYFSAVKQTLRKDLDNEKDLLIKKKYKLTKKAALTTTKIFKALRDYNSNPFPINVTNFEIYFVDHELNRNNLQKCSFPKDKIYNISDSERNIIAAVRDTIKVNETDVFVEANGVNHKLQFQTKELWNICKKGNFKSGKESIRLHTIIEYRNKAIFAVDYAHQFVYFLFVFKQFTIIIHDQMNAERHTTRTMEGRVLANRYRGILEELDKSGL